MGAFIQANFVPLMTMVVAVFALGLFLWFMGTAMRKEGDAQHQAILDREETQARTAFWRHHGPGDTDTGSTDPLYPPVEEDYS